MNMNSNVPSAEDIWPASCRKKVTNPPKEAGILRRSRSGLARSLRNLFLRRGRQNKKIKIRQFNFELTFNGLICKRFISTLTIVYLGDLWVSKVSVRFSFLQQLDPKKKNKP